MAIDLEKWNNDLKQLETIAKEAVAAAGQARLVRKLQMECDKDERVAKIMEERLKYEVGILDKMLSNIFDKYNCKL